MITFFVVRFFVVVVVLAFQFPILFRKFHLESLLNNKRWHFCSNNDPIVLACFFMCSFRKFDWCVLHFKQNRHRYNYFEAKNHIFVRITKIFVVIIWEIRTLSENSIFWSTMVFIHTAKSMAKTNQQRNGYKTVISKKTNYRIEQSIDENTMVFIAHHSYNAKRSMIRHFYIFLPWFWQRSADLSKVLHCWLWILTRTTKKKFEVKIGEKMKSKRRQMNVR